MQKSQRRWTVGGLLLYWLITESTGWRKVQPRASWIGAKRPVFLPRCLGEPRGRSGPVNRKSGPASSIRLPIGTPTKLSFDGILPVVLFLFQL